MREGDALSLPKGWKEVEIKSFAEIVGGGTPSTKNEEYWNGDIPWITPNDLSNHTFKYIERGERNITDLGLSKSSAKLHPLNTILLTSRAPIGYLALAKNEVSTNQGFQSIRCDEKQADANYVYYALQVYMDRVKALASGATFPEVSGKKVGKVKLPLPPLETQKKIASILSGYDDLIENNLKRIKILEEMAQQTYEEWFVRMRFPGYETAEMNVETGLPKGWGVSKLGDLVFLQTKSVHPNGLPKDTPYIGLEHIPRKSITISSWETAEKVDSIKYEFKKRDILFGKIRPYFHKVGVALTDGIASSDTIILRPKRTDIHGLILQTVFSNHFVDSATKSSNGTKMPRANWNVLSTYSVVIPSLDLIAKYDQLNTDVIDLISSYVNQNQRLREARDILLPRLMMGMIEV